MGLVLSALAPLLPAIERFGPEQKPDFGADPKPFVAMMLLGFVIGVAGHIYKSKLTVAFGIGLVFLSTVALPLATNVVKSS